MTTYTLNKEVLKTCREIGKCPCRIEETKCPCDDFLHNDNCICGAYEKKEEEE